MDALTASGQGLDWMIDDPGFSTQPARLQHKEEFERLVQEKLMEAPAQDRLSPTSQRER